MTTHDVRRRVRVTRDLLKTYNKEELKATDEPMTAASPPSTGAGSFAIAIAQVHTPAALEWDANRAGGRGRRRCARPEPRRDRRRAHAVIGDEPFAQLGSYDYLDDPNGLFADKGDDAATHAY